MYKKEDIPRVGDYVIGRITEISDVSVKCELEEYKDVTGIIPIDELPRKKLSSLQNKKMIFVVVDVDPNSRIVTLSLKRVNENKAKIKVLEYRKEQIAYNIINLISKKEKIDIEELNKNIVNKIIKHDKLYNSFIEIYSEGEKVLTQKYKIKKEYASLLVKYIKEYFKPPKYEINQEIYAYSIHFDGLNKIKEFFGKIIDLGFDVKYLGGGKYRIYYSTLSSKDVQEKSKILNKMLEEESKKYEVNIEIIKNE